MLGLAKELPTEQMRALILQDMVVSGLLRGKIWPQNEHATYVTDLLAQGVEAERVFLGSSGGKAQNLVTPAVLLNISVQ